jgi:hypothetical protein
MSFSRHILDYFGRSISQSIRNVRKLLLSCPLLKVLIKANLKKSRCYLSRELGLFIMMRGGSYRYNVIDFSITGGKCSEVMNTHTMKMS